MKALSTVRMVNMTKCAYGRKKLMKILLLKPQVCANIYIQDFCGTAFQ